MARQRLYKKYTTLELRDLVKDMFQNISMKTINKMGRTHLVILLNGRNFKGRK